MASEVLVKVVGFRDAERHALNTLFRLAQGRPTSYVLWTLDCNVTPHLFLIDTDSYEGALEIASPGFNKNLKLICVGDHAPASAWRAFTRPLNWPAIVHCMDQLFVGSKGADFDLDTGERATAVVPPGVRASLLVDASKDQRMYLRARLALAGLIEISEAGTAQQALELAGQRHYDLAIVNLDNPELDGWKLTDQLVALQPAIGSVVLSTRKSSWHLQELADQAGCRGVIEIPFEPIQILQMLRKV
jgi:CheY-like chemotaxis protein